MATTSLPARFYAGTLGTSAGTVYTVPAGETDVITSVTLDNSTNGAVQATMTMANVGFFQNLDLAPRQVMILDFKQVLNAGDSIQLSANTASAVTVFISGVKVTA
jgi:copper(I)-binding protein